MEGNQKFNYYPRGWESNYIFRFIHSTYVTFHNYLLQKVTMEKIMLEHVTYL